MLIVIRQCNVDYVLLSALVGVTLRLLITYDIACQWYINFKTRCSGLPEAIKFDPIGRQVDYVIPKFHIAAHGSKCQSKFSLNFRRFMARTDGENIERGWAWMNPASLSTREMGPGARHDTLDDQWMSWNYALVSRLGMFSFSCFIFVRYF